VADASRRRFSELPERYAFAIAATYLVLGGLYIGCSDAVVGRFALSVAHLQRLEMIKGWAFIAVTAVGLYLFSRALFRRLSQYGLTLARQAEAYHLLDRRALAGALASMVAHDSNNMLTLAKLNTELLRARPEPAVREVAEEIDAAVDRLVEMMRRLRDLGSQARALEARELDVAGEVSRSVDRLRRHARMHTCSVEFRSEGAVPMRVFPVLIDELVMNLVLNAAEAGSEACKILVEVRPTSAGVSIAVSDNGPGIPAELREQVFEPFFTTKSEGTGLGLLSVRACADAHGGNVAIEASELGGARFVVNLEPAEVEKSDSVAAG